jgi:quinol-cytochrome oxidoreductase complex cytochrome b subunit
LVFNLAVMFIFIYGFLYDFGSHVVPQDRPTNIVILLSNIIFSIVTSYLIIRWSPNSKETTN